MLRATFPRAMMIGLAIIPVVFLSSGARAADCVDFPQVAWWNDLTHGKVIAYVNQNHSGDWSGYIDKWARQLTKVQALKGLGKGIIIPSTGAKLEGIALDDYVSKLKQRVEINTCLALQAGAKNIIAKADDIAAKARAGTPPADPEFSPEEAETLEQEPDLSSLPELEPEPMTFVEAVNAFRDDEHETAIKAFKLMANGGDANAQNALGYMYRRGLGADKDTLQSMFWYRKAAKQGSAVAQYSLGEITRKEGQTKVQKAAALEWITKAAKQNYGDAQFTLGLIFFQGEGITKDINESYFWLALGNENSHDKSSQLLAHVETLIDEDAKLEQDQKIENWLSKDKSAQ